MRCVLAHNAKTLLQALAFVPVVSAVAAVPLECCPIRCSTRGGFWGRQGAQRTCACTTTNGRLRFAQSSVPCTDHSCAFPAPHCPLPSCPLTCALLQVCNFFEDRDRGQYHCPGCGICRVGGPENYFHCATCVGCFPTSQRPSHAACVADAMKSTCPVCLEVATRLEGGVWTGGGGCQTRNTV